MGLFSNNNQNQKQKGWNLHFFDDDTFAFRNLDIKDNWLVEHDEKNKPIAAYMHELPKKFDGYKNIPAGTVTVTYGRDILFDYATELKDKEKPEKGQGLKNEWMKKLAQAVVYRLDQEAKPSSTADKMVMFMGGVALLLALSIGIKVGIR